MDDELVLLTSYFNLADGKRQDTADTFRVDADVESATAPEGAAALYVVTEASIGGNMGRRARRVAADTIAWEYAAHGEEPPAVRLKGALRAAHEAIRQEFEGHVGVGVSVMAVEGDTVFLGQVAPAQVYVLHEGSLSSIPAATPGDSPFARALGAERSPQILVFKDQIAADDVLALCTSWFHHSVDPAEIRECFTAGSVDEIIETMLDVGKSNGARDATAIVVEAVLASELDAADGEDDTPGFVEQMDTAVQALANVGRFLWTELHVGDRHPAVALAEPEPAPEVEDIEGAGARPARGWQSGRRFWQRPPREAGRAHGPSLDDLPPAEPEISTGSSPVPSNGGSPPPAASSSEAPKPNRFAEGLTEEIPIVTGEPDEPLLPPEPQPRPAPEPRRQVPQSEPEAAPDQTRRSKRRVQRPASPLRHQPNTAPDAGQFEEPAPRPEVQEEIEAVNSRIQADTSEGDMGDVIPPVQAFPDTGTEPERIYATSKDIDAVNRRRPRRFGGVQYGTVREGNGPTVVRPPLADINLDRPAPRPAPHAAVWLGIAAVFILAAGALYVFAHNRTPVVHADPYPAKARKNIRLALAARSPQRGDHYLGLARQDVSLARSAGASTATLHKLTARIGTASDTIHHIARVANPVVVTNFAQFPKSQPSQIAVAPGLVFVLDTGRNTVFSINLNASGSSGGPTTIVQSGEVDSGFTVGTPVQLASDPSTSTALVLDDRNVLVRDSSGTKTATQLTQSTPNQKVVAMATSSPDVYTLDTASSQVWRYPDAVSGYNPAAAAYWDSNPPNLSKAVSFALDGTDLYILRSDGSILKFDFQANPVKFAPSLTTALSAPVSLYTAQGLNYVWIADPAHGRIVQLTKAGGYVRTYLSSSPGMNLHATKSIAVGPAGNTLYALVGSKVFDFKLVH